MKPLQVLVRDQHLVIWCPTCRLSQFVEAGLTLPELAALEVEHRPVHQPTPDYDALYDGVYLDGET